VLGVPLEFFLMLGYAVSLALIALSLELVARHVHQRSLNGSTIGFTYHKDRDVWQCPQDQHLFPVFADTAKGRVIYRAPASTCNACRSKHACTDSDSGRTIERKVSSGLEYGMERFHRAMSITLIILACLIVGVEFFRVGGLYPRSVLATVFALLGAIAARLGRELLSQVSPPSAATQSPSSGVSHVTERGWFGRGR
jgi:hypothetical protein